MDLETSCSQKQTKNPPEGKTKKQVRMDSGFGRRLRQIKTPPKAILKERFRGNQSGATTIADGNAD